jgi:pyruvate dehydrogenase E2 component (dihydrolipoamide acetyltransferase)
MIKEIKLPEVGENVESGEIAKVLVAVGDLLEVEQPVLEFETDKAVVEVPSPYKGKVIEISVKANETIAVGQVFMKVETETKDDSVQVEEKTVEDKVSEIPVEEPTKIETPTEVVEKPQEEFQAKKIEFEPSKDVAPASPSVRRLARELGVNINQIQGNGPGGRISADDVKNHTKKIVVSGKTEVSSPVGISSETLPDFSKWGEIDVQPMNKVRKTTANHLSYAWVTIPHVTQFDKADITDLEPLRKRFGENVKAAGGKLTMTAILLNVIASALKVFPQFNASIDMSKKEIIYKKYINIGIAVDTERGLLVPVIKNVDQKNITQISVELTEIAEKARLAKLTLNEMQGGNFSISNLGGIGGTYFTPVINAPEVSILGVSRSEFEQVYMGENFQPRLMLPLSLSYDHRIIDGADAIRFLRWVIEALEQPFVLALEG